MSRRCVLSGKGVLTGNNVSHANNRTRRRFLPNLRARRLFSEVLGETIRLRIANNTLRTIEKVGGLDPYLLAAGNADLPTELVRMRRRLVEAKAAIA
jgi:large subunit ribosomal protein L28